MDLKDKLKIGDRDMAEELKELEKKKQVLELKSQLFDLIRQQEQIMAEFNQLNETKMKKILELQELEAQ